MAKKMKREGTLQKLSDLKKPHVSYPNNPLLAGTFYLADYIQKAGSGTLEMLRQCRA